MKFLIIKMVFTIFVFIGISNYVLYVMTGKTPFNFNDLSMPEISMPSIPGMPAVDDTLDGVPGLPSQKEAAYKWKDQNGVVHYSSTPPQGQTNATIIEVDPNTNLVMGTPVPRKEEKKVEAQKTNHLPTAMTPGNVKKLIDDAKNVQKLMDDRYAEQNKILDSL